MTQQQPSLRPREKIAERSVTALSDHELLQTMIGSGNKTAPVTALSRRVLKLLRRNREPLSFHELREIPGLGIASAAKLVAAFELASRYPTVSESPSLHMKVLQPQLKPRPDTLSYIILDGAHRPVAQYDIPVPDAFDQTACTSTIFRQCLRDGAAGLMIAISLPRSNIILSDMSFRKRIGESATLFNIVLRGYVLYLQDERRELL